MLMHEKTCVIPIFSKASRLEFFISMIYGKNNQIYRRGWGGNKIIYRTNSKTSQVNSQSVFNPLIFHHFPKNLDRKITFNSVTESLKNTQTEPQKYINFFNQTNKI